MNKKKYSQVNNPITINEFGRFIKMKSYFFFHFSISETVETRTKMLGFSLLFYI